MSAATSLEARRPAPQRWKTTKYRADSAPTGELFELVSSARTSPDGKYRFVWTLAPGKRGPGEHYHRGVETFEVVSGTLRIWNEGVPADFGPGDVLAAAAGQRHRFLNPGAEPVVVNVSIDGTDLEDCFAPIAVATLGRPLRFGEVLRMLVTIGERMPSIPASRVAAAMFRLLLVLKVFGVKPYEPVIGWDRAGAQA